MAGRLHYTPQSGGKSRRAAKSAARQDPPLNRSTPTPPPDSGEVLGASQARQRNVKAVLSLGDTRYVTVRSLGMFAIPPVPFKAGQIVMTIYTDTLIAANTAITTGTKESQQEYFALLGRLARVLHKHMRPVGLVKRNLWRFGLTRNPFRQCSEQELKDIAQFFLLGRMRSSVQLMSETTIQETA